MKAIAYMPIQITYSENSQLKEIVRVLADKGFSCFSSAGWEYKKGKCTQKSIKIKKIK